MKGICNYLPVILNVLSASVDNIESGKDGWGFILENPSVTVEPTKNIRDKITLTVGENEKKLGSSPLLDPQPY